MTLLVLRVWQAGRSKGDKRGLIKRFIKTWRFSKVISSKHPPFFLFNLCFRAVLVKNTKFRKVMVRWRLQTHFPISINFSDYLMIKCIRTPISLRNLYFKYPLPYGDVCFLLKKRHLLLNCRNKSERIFARLFCCLLGTRWQVFRETESFGCCGNYFRRLGTPHSVFVSTLIPPSPVL